MIKNKQTFFLGIFILLVWTFFGIPTSWKIFLTILSALYLIVLSVKILLPKRGVVRVQARRREKITPVWSESAPSVPMPTLPSVERTDADVANSNQLKDNEF